MQAVHTLSARASAIQPSPTLAMNQKAAALKAAGVDVIALSLGEPDFDTPGHIKAAAIDAIQKNFTKYTATEGALPLREAISRKLRRDNGLDYGPGEVVAGSGAKLVLLAALTALLDAGDEVIIPSPYWVSYPELAELAGGVASPVSCPERDGFKLTAARLEAAITGKTRVLMLNSPCNPTGAVYSVQEFRELAAVLAAHPRIWVVTDELYEHIVFDGIKAVSFAAAAPEIASRVITVNGLSKGYVMTGWRVGFAAGPRDAMTAIANLLSQMHGSVNSISQMAAKAALLGDPSYIARNTAEFGRRRDLVVERIGRMKGLRITRPDGSFYAFIGCTGLLGRRRPGGQLMQTDLDVAQALLEDARVAVVPGVVFGAPGYLRISYALDMKLIDQAMQRIENFLKTLD
jgi:aspartate aminotransferase